MIEVNARSETCIWQGKQKRGKEKGRKEGWQGRADSEDGTTQNRDSEGEKKGKEGGGRR